MPQDSEHIVHQPHQASLDELRTLILGLSPDELATLHAWLKTKDAFTEEIGRILPKAVQISLTNESPLAAILLPVVEEAIFTSVKNNPKTLADALFPVMGAAIRKSISDTFREMIQSLNQTLENSFSVERIKWRLEAAFSSKSFAEIVLLKGVKYSVKSVFLVHKETGLLIQDVYSSADLANDADMVSSMLTAVQDFVKDSFAAQLHSSDTLDTIKLNDFNVWIEDGPLAYLAVVIEGTPPETVRTVFKENIEEIHGKYTSTIENFEGDSLDGIPLKPLLQNCMVNQEFDQEEKSHAKAYLIISGVAILLGVWGGFSFHKKYQWQKFITDLKAQKSVVIIENTYTSDGYYVHGMKDIMQSGFGQIALQHNMDSNEITYNWVNYLSLAPEFVYQRMLQEIPLENSVTVNLHHDTAVFAGKASQAWMTEMTTYWAHQHNGLVVDMRAVKAKELDQIAVLQHRINTHFIQFSFGVTYLRSADKEVLHQVINDFKSYQKLVPQSYLEVVISTDTVGVESENIRFAKKRYTTAKNYLVKNGINKNHIELKIPTTATTSPRLMRFTPKKVKND